MKIGINILQNSNSGIIIVFIQPQCSFVLNWYEILAPTQSMLPRVYFWIKYDNLEYYNYILFNYAGHWVYQKKIKYK